MMASSSVSFIFSPLAISLGVWRSGLLQLSQGGHSEILLHFFLVSSDDRCAYKIVKARPFTFLLLSSHSHRKLEADKSGLFEFIYNL